MLASSTWSANRRSGFLLTIRESRDSADVSHGKCEYRTKTSISMSCRTPYGQYRYDSFRQARYQIQ